jgi:hypothetical protein
MVHRWRLGLSKELVPSLTSLYWELRSIEDMHGLCHFLSPNIESLSIMFYTEASLYDLQSLVESLEVLSPPITDLALWLGAECHVDPDAFAVLMVRIVSACPKVARLSTNTHVFASMLHFCPTLSELERVRLDEDIPWKEDGSQGNRHINFKVPENAFPELQSIDGAGISFWHHFLPIVGHSIQTICFRNLGGHIKTTSEDIFKLFEVIGNACHCLESFRLEKLDIDCGPSEFVGAFRPLLQCVQLVTFEIEGDSTSEKPLDFCFSLSDSDLEEVAVAWPFIETLCIRGQHHVNQRPPLTLKSIVALSSRACKPKCKICQRRFRAKS